MVQGNLFYVIGPSGSGKDSLLNYAREHMEASHPVLFAHRYITRPAEAGGENYISLTHEEFRQRQSLGLFCLEWESHHNLYGVGTEVTTWLNTGSHVVVNGSRAYLPIARLRFPQIKVIQIQVSDEIIRQRLEERGRESPEEIDARIAHNNQMPPLDDASCQLITNDASLAESGPRFIQLLQAE